VAFDGRVGELIRLDQSRVYADVLEGVPNRTINQGIVQQAVAVAKRLHHLNATVIEPTERRLDRGGLAADEPTNEFTPFALPAVQCIGTFRAHGHARDPDATYSDLCVVWYQEAMALPIDPTIRDAMSSLSWADLATDGFT
jgi:hypothetical protein